MAEVFMWRSWMGCRRGGKIGDNIILTLCAAATYVYIEEPLSVTDLI